VLLDTIVEAVELIAELKLCVPFHPLLNQARLVSTWIALLALWSVKFWLLAKLKYPPIAAKKQAGHTAGYSLPEEELGLDSNSSKAEW